MRASSVHRRRFWMRIVRIVAVFPMTVGCLFIIRGGNIGSIAAGLVALGVGLHYVITPDSALSREWAEQPRTWRRIRQLLRMRRREKRALKRDAPNQSL